jgi:hypothetical protein
VVFIHLHDPLQPRPGRITCPTCAKKPQLSQAVQCAHAMVVGWSMKLCGIGLALCKCTLACAFCLPRPLP